MPRLSELVLGKKAALAGMALATWPVVLEEVAVSAWTAGAVLAARSFWRRRQVRSGLPKWGIEPIQPVRVSVSIRAEVPRRGQWIPGAARPLAVRRRPAQWAPGWKSPWRGAPPLSGQVAAARLRSAVAWNGGVPTNRSVRRTAGRGADRRLATTPAATGRYPRCRARFRSFITEPVVVSAAGAVRWQPSNRRRYPTRTEHPVPARRSGW